MKKLFTPFLVLFFLITTFSLFSQTTVQRVNGKDTLVAYTDVPGLKASEFYKIEVKSAATNGDWIECYSNITRSLWSSLPADAKLTNGAKDYYYTYLKDWSHTYSNIEMSRGSLVEVRISAKNNFKIRPTDYPNGFTKANAHPAHKASKPTVVNNIVYFSITKPCQITIDINGQMDEVNTGNGYNGPAIHTVSLFANPVMKKPSLTDPNVLVVEPGVKPPTNLGDKTILYFKPGVHDIGRKFTIFANKSYYIPGDAIVYGTLHNTASGANIRIYGYGTLSGDRIRHEYSDPEYPDGTKSWKLLWSENCSNFRVEGISLMNCPTHTANMGVANGSGKQTFVRWCKILSWRINGDGIGTGDEISDCFFRTQDDCTYVKGDRLRNVYWTDVNGSIFSMAGMDWAGGKPMLIDDCDIIYPRHCSTAWDGGRVFAKRGGQTGGNNTTTYVNATFSNIRITDKYQTLETFCISSKDDKGTSKAYGNIIFKNITSVKVPEAGDNRFNGHAGGVWDNITFDNVVLGGKKILKTTDFAVMGPYVTNIKFRAGTTDIKPLAVDPKNDLIVYPNPTSNKLFINTNGKLINKIELIDFAGKVVYQSNHVNSDASINLKGMSKGLYMLKVHSNDKTSAAKIMVQ